MKHLLLSTVLIVGVGLIACTKQTNTSLESQLIDNTENETNDRMKNLISIVEIPAEDFSRAITFYQAILDIKIEETEMEGIRMGLFPNTGEGVFIQLINGSGYKPSTYGTTIYLHGGDDLQKVVHKIEANGGKIIIPKTEIGPDMGFYALFHDTEGNKLGLHSQN